LRVLLALLGALRRSIPLLLRLLLLGLMRIMSTTTLAAALARLPAMLRSSTAA